MTEEEWLECESGPSSLEWPCVRFRTTLEWLGTFAKERQLLLFCLACCRTPLLDLDSQQWPILEAVERYADGLCAVDDVCATLSYMADGCPVLETGRFIEAQAEGHDISVPDSARRIADMKCGALVAGNGMLQASCVAKVEEQRRKQFQFLRDIFGNPFRPVTFLPAWRTTTARAIAAQMYESRDFSAMPILADALQDAGCEDTAILGHCRSEGLHVRGCWVVDFVLGMAAL